MRRTMGTSVCASNRAFTADGDQTSSSEVHSCRESRETRTGRLVDTGGHNYPAKKGRLSARERREDLLASLTPISHLSPNTSHLLPP
jgi:hypothetical protein